MIRSFLACLPALPTTLSEPFIYTANRRDGNLWSMTLFGKLIFLHNIQHVVSAAMPVGNHSISPFLLLWSSSYSIVRYV